MRFFAGTRESQQVDQPDHPANGCDRAREVAHACPGPVVYLAGGPGSAAIQVAPLLVDTGFNRDRELIILAQRGTPYSEPALTCPGIDRFNAQAVGLVYDAASTLRHRDESVTAFECFVPANANMPAPHCHDGFEETVYGLEGTTTYTIGGEDVQIGPGDCVCIPRGTVHAFRNDGDNDAKFLAVASPGVFGPSYFLDIAEVLARSPRDRRTFRRWVRSCAVMASYQLHLRGAEPLPQ